MLAVNDVELTHILDAFHPALLVFSNVVIGKIERLKHLYVACLVCSIFLLEVFEDVAHTQTVA